MITSVRESRGAKLNQSAELGKLCGRCNRTRYQSAVSSQQSL